MRRQKGFTLIELLIVVAIIGIIAAIAIPNLLNAINRGRQKRTMADIRSIGTAIEAYQVDFNYYPKGLTTVASCNPYITPTFIKLLPNKDGWNQLMGVASDAAGATYTIWSTGKGGLDATTTAPATASGQTTDFAAFIIFSNGRFMQWPEGMQVN